MPVSTFQGGMFLIPDVYPGHAACPDLELRSTFFDIKTEVATIEPVAAW